MIETFCNYGLHDEETGRCYEEGDTVTITMMDETVYADVDIRSISVDEIVIEDDDFNETTLQVNEIWEID